VRETLSPSSSEGLRGALSRELEGTSLIRRRSTGRTTYPSWLAIVAAVVIAAGFGAMPIDDRLASAVEDVPTTSRTSVSSEGKQANGGITGANTSNAGCVSISADGRYIAWASDADNLVPGDSNNSSDIFVRDRVANSTTRVSVAADGSQSNGASWCPSLSATGRHVVFFSLATNLVANDTNGWEDVFLYDVGNRSIERVNVATDGSQSSRTVYAPASLSSDGRYVAFTSPSPNLVPGDTNGDSDVFLRDRFAGTTSRVSVSSSGGQADSRIGAGCGSPSLSRDARYLAFACGETEGLVPGVSGSQVYFRDLQAGKTDLVGITVDGEQAFQAFSPSISADGRHVAFLSGNAYLRDVVARTTRLVSASTSDVEANGFTQGTPSVSSDGRFVAFQSIATNLVPNDTNDAADVFVKDMDGGAVIRASVLPNGMEGAGDHPERVRVGPALSHDGRFVTFVSTAKLVDTDTNELSDVYVRGPLPDPRNSTPIPPVTSGQDTDGDGLLDEWEKEGFDYDNDGKVDVDLPAMGANPLRKDIFLEIDWVSGDVNRKPSQLAIDRLVQAFRDSPAINPQFGKTGINLHITLSDAIPETPALAEIGEKKKVNGKCLYYWSEFEGLKRQHFSPAMRAISHYAIAAPRVGGGPGCPGPIGSSRNPDAESGASDFVYGLDFFRSVEGNDANALARMEAGVIMHELGHNLGLGHGGVTVDDQGRRTGADQTPDKPNHLSVMNYLFTTRGRLIPDDTRKFSYSEFDEVELAALDETSLDEGRGFESGNSAPNDFATLVTCAAGDMTYLAFERVEGPVDWNCDGDEVDVLAQDINGDNRKTVLHTVNEWRVLVYNGGEIGNFGPPMRLPVTTETPPGDRTPEEDQAMGPRSSPVANDDRVEAMENETLVVPAPGLLANDDARGGNVLTGQESSVAGGRVVLMADGALTYSPPTNFVGEDTFRYFVVNAAGVSSARVTITVKAGLRPIRFTVIGVAGKSILYATSNPSGRGTEGSVLGVVNGQPLSATSITAAGLTTVDGKEVLTVRFEASGGTSELRYRSIFAGIVGTVELCGPSECRTGFGMLIR
jgi:hypothetical protein